MELFLITGASKGLGQALAQLAVEQGHHVVAIARSAMVSSERLTSIQHDVQRVDQLPGLISSIFKKQRLRDFEAVHLINNAGVVEPVGFMQDLPAEDIAKNIDINLTAPMVLTAAFLKETAGFQGLRTIVNVSSGVAERPKETWAAYSAAKGGLRIFSHAIAQELKQDRKTLVISFNPGIMDTAMQETIRSHSPAEFPDVERFRDFKREGQLVNPSIVAAALLRHLPSARQARKIDVSIQELI